VSDIFLSYAREDLPRVKPVVDALAARGWSVWWDRTIQPGQVFARVIQAVLDEARCVIVLWSRDSVESDWVQSEADEGQRRGVLIPVLLDDVVISAGYRRLISLAGTVRFRTPVLMIWHERWKGFWRRQLHYAPAFQRRHQAQHLTWLPTPRAPRASSKSASIEPT
jgi:hypothetical protein